MPTVLATEPLSGPEAQEQLYALADRSLPGGGLGGYSLPEDLRFVIKRGEGSRVQSTAGRWYIDYVGGAGANILGHAHPHIVAAAQSQVAQGMHYFGTLSEAAITYAQKLVDLIPCAERVILTTTGSEATFYAMRIARAATGRNKILKFEGAYHGNHDYAAVSQFPTAPANYPHASVEAGGVPDVIPSTMLVAPYNDLQSVEAIVSEHKDDLAAIIVEPVQRIIFPKPGFLEGLRQICDRHAVLLIFDEVVTGFRLALGGAQEYFGVTPDLASYGKVVSGGGPLGCVAGRQDLIEHSNPKNKGNKDYAYINGTLHGNPIAAAAGMATIEVIEQPGFYERLHATSEELLTRLQEVLDRHGVPAIAAGRASFWQFLFLPQEPANQIDILRSDQKAMQRLDLALLQRGIYVLPGVRRFVSAVTTEQDIEETVDALDNACRELYG